VSAKQSVRETEYVCQSLIPSHNPNECVSEADRQTDMQANNQSSKQTSKQSFCIILIIIPALGIIIIIIIIIIPDTLPLLFSSTDCTYVNLPINGIKIFHFSSTR
jgi:lipopolysaccharide/colanic/teichoic acid biosynthesis glycosyltransferase